MKKEYKINKPSKFWMRVPTTIAGPFIKLKYNIHIDKKELKGLKAPFILIGNHASNLDPLFIQYAINPRVCNFVAGYTYFQNKFLNWYFTKCGIIRRFVYQADFKSMKDMLWVLKNNGSLAFFPGGRLPSCGESFLATEGLAKLIKMANVSVVACKIDGAYLSKPKWATSHKRRGRIDLKFSVILNQEDIQKLSNVEILKICNDSIYSNDYEWNRDKQIKYGKKKLAEGLESTLYRCPKCGSEFEMKTSNNSIKCKHCDFELELEPTGFFKTNDYFEHPLQYYEWQRNSVDKLIEDIHFKVNFPAKVDITDVHTLDFKQGIGEIELSYNNIIFKGYINNELTNVEFNIDELISLPYKVNENFEIAKGADVYKFYPDNGIIVSKLCLIVEQLYKKKHQ